jgi:hypothetical protein
VTRLHGMVFRLFSVRSANPIFTGRI